VNDRIEDKSTLDFDKFLEEFFTQDYTQSVPSKIKEKKSNHKKQMFYVKKLEASRTNLRNLKERKFKIKSAYKKKENIPLKLKSKIIFKNKVIEILQKVKQEIKINPCKKRVKTNKKDDIYNINNFIIHPNQIKITHKEKPLINIKIPQFQETGENNENSIFSDNSEEDICDSAYLKYHDQYEKREREYRLSLFADDKKKGKKFTRDNKETTCTDSSEGNFKIRIELNSIKLCTDKSDLVVKEFIIPA
jgi:hypothetical protein